MIFSGGSAANSLVDVFEAIRKSKSCSLSYIIPISDNGGSSSELIRVFGGPGIGDVRSRLVRLIPTEPYSQERDAIGTLLSSRLSPSNATEARVGWSELVDGTSQLWRGIPSAKKELIRAFFNLINLEILKRSRPPVSTFDFRSASIGNLFLTGARLFSGSFESAIYLLSSVCGIPDEDVKVIPSINSNFSHHIAAELEDGSVVVGQNSISHPSLSSTSLPESGGVPDYLTVRNELEGDSEEAEDAHPPFTLQTLRASNIAFSKAADELDDLPARIARVHYVNSFGQEILPPANPRAIQAIVQADAIIYSIGSLYTSIVPNLVLRGIGEGLHKAKARTRLLVLNGCLDREVGPLVDERPFTAADFIDAIVKAGEQSRGFIWSPYKDRDARPSKEQVVDTTNQVNTSIQPGKRPSIARTRSEGRALDSGPVSRVLPPPMLASTMPTRAPTPTQSEPSTPVNENSRASSSKPHSIYEHYVTHLIHLPNSDETPYVDRDLLTNTYGVKCIRVYGRRNTNGPGMLYDPQALKGAIDAILGAATDSATPDDTKFERKRRNTVDG